MGYEPHSYDDGMTNWEKPSHPKPTYKKTQKPTWQKPAKYSKAKPAWKKDSKPTWQKNGHESYEKETVSHIYNPYDIRQRGIVKAQLEERIESDMQELAALDALELETVSDEQQDLDGEGLIETAGTFGFNNAPCSGRFDCRSGCCEGGRCVEKKRDWANIPYCPAECKGFPFARGGTC